jgi:adenosylcobinamide-GDP ribazoletransferase
MTKELFALLTRLRVPGASMDLSKAARQQYLFPVVGLVVGLTVALATLLLDNFLDDGLAMVIAGLALALLYSINGMLHIEGLADFADGLMASGTAEKKRAAMKDVHSGVGAVFVTVLYVVLLYGLLVVICSQPSSEIPMPLSGWTMAAFGIVVAEMSGKLAIVTAAYVGPSSHPGMGSLFVQEAGLSTILIAMVVAVIAAALLTGLLFPLVLIGVVVGVLVAMRARRDLGGVSGDVFGAANELGRLVTLFWWVLLL